MQSPLESHLMLCASSQLLSMVSLPAGIPVQDPSVFSLTPSRQTAIVASCCCPTARIYLLVKVPGVYTQRAEFEVIAQGDTLAPLFVQRVVQGPGQWTGGRRDACFFSSSSSSWRRRRLTAPRLGRSSGGRVEAPGVVHAPCGRRGRHWPRNRRRARAAAAAGVVPGSVGRSAGRQPRLAGEPRG